MPKIKNIEGLSMNELNQELNNGGRFVIFQYCVSILIMTFRQPTDIYFIRNGESTLKHSLGFSIITLLFGWWGIPWGPIYTIGSLYTNLTGGKDVTQTVLDSMKTPETSNQDLV